MAMKKIPFNIKYRDKIESGEYTVITFSGYPVKIYRWDYKDKDGTPILGSYVQGGYEYAAGWYEDGRFNAKPSDLDLMLVIDDTELLTPLAKQLSDYLKNDFEFFTTKKWDEAKWNEVMNIQAAELQRLAYLEKQKEPHYTKRNALFDKCVENCDPEVMKEVSNKVDEMLGKEQKPAWKPSEEQLNALNFAITYFMHETNYKNPTELRELYEQLKKL